MIRRDGTFSDEGTRAVDAEDDDIISELSTRNDGWMEYNTNEHTAIASKARDTAARTPNTRLSRTSWAILLPDQLVHDAIFMNLRDIGTTVVQPSKDVDLLKSRPDKPKRSEFASLCA